MKCIVCTSEKIIFGTPSIRIKMYYYIQQIFLKSSLVLALFPYRWPAVPSDMPMALDLMSMILDKKMFFTLCYIESGLVFF